MARESMPETANTSENANELKSVEGRRHNGPIKQIKQILAERKNLSLLKQYLQKELESLIEGAFNAGVFPRLSLMSARIEELFSDQCKTDSERQCLIRVLDHQMKQMALRVLTPATLSDPSLSRQLTNIHEALFKIREKLAVVSNQPE